MTILSIFAVNTIFSVGTVLTVLAVSSFGFYIGVGITNPPISVLDVGSLTVSTVLTILTIFAINTVFAVGTVLTVFAVRTFSLYIGIGITDPPIAVFDVGSLTIRTIFTVLAIFAVNAVFAVGSVCTLSLHVSVGITNPPIAVFDVRSFTICSILAIFAINAILTIGAVNAVLTVVSVCAVRNGKCGSCAICERDGISIHKPIRIGLCDRGNTVAGITLNTLSNGFIGIYTIDVPIPILNSNDGAMSVFTGYTLNTLDALRAVCYGKGRSRTIGICNCISINQSFGRSFCNIGNSVSCCTANTGSRLISINTVDIPISVLNSDDGSMSILAFHALDALNTLFTISTVGNGECGCFTIRESNGIDIYQAFSRCFDNG